MNFLKTLIIALFFSNFLIKGQSIVATAAVDEKGSAIDYYIGTSCFNAHSDVRDTLKKRGHKKTAEINAVFLGKGYYVLLKSEIKTSDGKKMIYGFGAAEDKAKAMKDAIANLKNKSFSTIDSYQMVENSSFEACHYKQINCKAEYVQSGECGKELKKFVMDYVDVTTPKEAVAAGTDNGYKMPANHSELIAYEVVYVCPDNFKKSEINYASADSRDLLRKRLESDINKVISSDKEACNINYMFALSNNKPVTDIVERDNIVLDLKKLIIQGAEWYQKNYGDNSKPPVKRRPDAGVRSGGGHEHLVKKQQPEQETKQQSEQKPKQKSIELH
jgi:hypothetical protein